MIASEIDHAAVSWGVKVLRYEIRNIQPPEGVVRAIMIDQFGQRYSHHSQGEGMTCPT